MNPFLDPHKSWVLWIAAIPVFFAGVWAIEAAPPIEPEQAATAIPAVVYVAAPVASPPEPGAEVVADPPPGSATAPSCTIHLAEPGDSWWGIADRANLDPYVLLDLNFATPETLILIGDPICLPPGTAITPPTSSSTTKASTNESSTSTPTQPAPETTAPESTSGSTTSLAPTPSPSSTPSTTTPSSATRIPPQIPISNDKPPLGTDGDCATWRPILAWYGFDVDWAVRTGQRESGCTGTAYNPNSNTQDLSFGFLQANRYSNALARWYDHGGYTLSVMRTADGALAAAAVLFHDCGYGAWIKPSYNCEKGYKPVPTINYNEWTDQR